MSSLHPFIQPQKLSLNGKSQSKKVSKGLFYVLLCTLHYKLFFKQHPIYIYIPGAREVCIRTLETVVLALYITETHT